MKDLIQAIRVADKLEAMFATVADLLGAEKAFYVFAGEVVKAELGPETERKFVEIIKLTYDEYVAKHA